MNDIEDKLADLRKAWTNFKDVAHQTSRQQRQAFSDILKEMDAAEITVVRADVLQAYDKQS